MTSDGCPSLCLKPVIALQIRQSQARMVAKAIGAPISRSCLLYSFGSTVKLKHPTTTRSCEKDAWIVETAFCKMETVFSPL